MRTLVPFVSSALLFGLIGCTPDRDEGTDPPPPSGDGLGETGDMGQDSGGADSGSGTDDGGVIDWPDIGTDGECSPLLQDCDEGQKCTAWADDGGTFWNANRCVEVTGTGVEGDSCTTAGGLTGMDDCDEGFICLNVATGGGGACVAFCQGTERNCPSGDNCAVYNDGVLPLCLPGCDPLLQDCPDSQSCIDTPAGEFICFADASGAEGAEGDPCPVSDGENSCDPGLWCGPGWAGCTDVNCCTPYCDINEPNPCTAPNQCVSFYGDPSGAPPEYAHVGVCVVPE